MDHFVYWIIVQLCDSTITTLPDIEKHNYIINESHEIYTVIEDRAIKVSESSNELPGDKKDTSLSKIKQRNSRFVSVEYEYKYPLMYSGNE